LIGLAAGLTVACQPAETPEQAAERMAAETAAATAAIDSANARMASFVPTESADSLASMYATDARLYPEGEPLVEGRDAIRAKYAEWFAMGTAQIETRRLGLTVNGTLAVERIAWTMTITAEPGAPPMEPMVSNGKGVIVWQRIGDQWLIVDDIGNSDAPMAPPGGAGS
jgi:ketosteroid isomerase-like protein